MAHIRDLFFKSRRKWIRPNGGIHFGDLYIYLVVQLLVFSVLLAYLIFG